MEQGHFLAAMQCVVLRPELILRFGACSSTTEANREYRHENNVR